ncbi:AAA family ATPase [Yinghuangia sp. ASG 101]|uniref:BTAD domain-containing putative transcriptional regulator n=1 Tax=Yinghuangia sp. ASG 101 TaxID=2896848 RepID=UPI001E285E59|nr:BTAD domain-containing putative transcriptional regulator [Yinghuangia sp. ASG 101]UGQ13430.1 AAA family ATPase [Yinghuangia sp. ASG 101]
MTAIRDGSPVPLGGANQRAVLAFLLLRPNRVVATSELIRALWGDAAPPTARKMVQNAVAGLRRALGTAPGVELSTVSPGYVLRVDAEAIDLTRFDTLIRSGRTEIRAGNAERGALLLREALRLWQGPVLVDVTETGIRWPELAMIRETHLTAFEECLEAELAFGRHREVVGELAAMGQQEPTRERTCGLLMLALYRCGRQAEALSAYQRLRDELVDDFGLDPAPELRELERSILKQHPMLDLPRLPGRTALPATPRPPSAPARPEPGTDAAHASPRPDRSPAPADVPPATPALTERKQASILLIRAQAGAGTDDPEHLDEALHGLHRIVAEEAARFGGLVREPLGRLRTVLFGLPRTHEDDPSRAVATALAIRDRLDRLGARLTVRLAVATGDVLARYRSEDDGHPTEVTGAVLDHGERLLRSADPHRVHLCDRTRAATDLDRLTGCVKAAAGPANTPTRPPEPPRHTVPLIGRDRDLDILSGLSDDVRRRERPHLVTVFGEPGIGKTRLVSEFARRTSAAPTPVHRLTGRVTAFGTGRSLAPLAAIVREHCGIAPADTPETAARRLAATVRGLLGAGPDADRVVAGLRRCLGTDTAPRVHDPAFAEAFAEVFAAWRRLIEEIAARHPLVVVLEDLHLADDVLLDHVEDLTERALRVPLFVVATARSELRERRPRWCCGKRDATAVVLDPLSDGATSVLLDRLQTRPPGIPVAPRVLALIGGIPRYAEEYAPALPGLPPGAVPDLPPALRALVAARLDTLPVAEKAVLRDASVFEGPLWTSGVAAVGGRSHEAVEAALRRLESKDFLRRVRRGTLPGDTEYVFRHSLVRAIGYAQLTRRDRLLRHLRAVDWIAGLATDRGDLVVHHRHKVLALAATDADAAERAHRAFTDAARKATAADNPRSAAHCRRGAADLCATTPKAPPEPVPPHRHGLRLTTHSRLTDSAASRVGVFPQAPSLARRMATCPRVG